MELKCRNSQAHRSRFFPFNRTAYGIEMQITSFSCNSCKSFNRTAYGIEIKKSKLNNK